MHSPGSVKGKQGKWLRPGHTALFQPIYSVFQQITERGNVIRRDGCVIVNIIALAGRASKGALVGGVCFFGC